jgi:hypothetical protein
MEVSHMEYAFRHVQPNDRRGRFLALETGTGCSWARKLPIGDIDVEDMPYYDGNRFPDVGLDLSPHTDDETEPFEWYFTSAEKSGPKNPWNTLPSWKRPPGIPGPYSFQFAALRNARPERLSETTWSQGPVPVFTVIGEFQTLRPKLRGAELELAILDCLTRIKAAA